MEEMVEVTAERAVYPRPTLPSSVTILNNKSPTSSSSQEPPSSDPEPAAPLPPKKQSLMSEIAVRMQCLNSCIFYHNVFPRGAYFTFFATHRGYGKNMLI